MSLAVRLLVICAVVVTVSSAGILESLLSWELPDAEARSTTAPSKCLCQTSGCLCCVDLNLTSTIDLGGPACLNLKQKEQNVTLNMSYGDGAVHNATIKIADATNKPTCMDLLADLAQICARFTSVKETDSGHDACLVVEPALLGSPQATYNIGCFNFNQSIRQIEVAVTEAPEAVEVPEEEEDSLNTEELIAAVSASAEQGIALFSQWLGLNLNPKLNLTSPSNNKNPGQESRTEVNPSSSRMSRKMETDVQEEKNDERFKQLLSAQDNIQKESAKIGQTADVETTFVYSEALKPVEATVAEKLVAVKEPEVAAAEQLAIIPRESRRGGRAYNIHQHVNEV